MADATDLPFSEELLDDDSLVDNGKVTAAVDHEHRRAEHHGRPVLLALLVRQPQDFGGDFR